MAAPYSGRTIDYLGSGLFASRPAAPNLYPGTVGLYYCTDVGSEKLTAWDGAVWADIAGGTTVSTVSIVTEASASTMDPATHAGLNRLVEAGGDVTFDSAETYVAGQVFNISATAAIDLVGDGVTLTPPAGGTLALDTDMSVTVVMKSGTTGRVIGQTVPA